MSEPRIQELNEILAALTKNIGLPNLKFSDDGCRALGVESGRINHLQHEGNLLLFFAELGTLAAGTQRTEMFEELLRANVFWVGTNGSTLCLAPESGQVPLARHEKIDTLTADGIESPLGHFIESAEHWAAKIVEGRVAFAEQPLPSQQSLPGSFA